VTFLLPVRWEDDWPIILGEEEAVSLTPKRPNLPAQPPAQIPHNGSFTWRDEFDSASLSPLWNFLRTPREPWYSLTRKPGSLLIEPRPVELGARDNPSLIARRQQHADFRASTRLVPSDDPLVDCGLVAFMNETHYFFLGVRADGAEGFEIFLDRAAGKEHASSAERIARAALPAPVEGIELRISGAGRDFSFGYRDGGREWTSLAEGVDGSILSTDVAGGFVGTYVGMFARRRGSP
jgi:alpha-N-arabinofuranosidase